MRTWILLLRGINVGGKNIIKMAELVDLLTGLSLQHVKTYIQSGNAVFQTDECDAITLTDKIANGLQQRFGFQPQLLLLDESALKTAMDGNPFPTATADAKTLHLFFLQAPVEHADLDSLAAVRAETEQYQLANNVFYLQAPDGIGRSKLAAKVERCLGVPVTARNWRTVTKLREMASSLND